MICKFQLVYSNGKCIYKKDDGTEEVVYADDIGSDDSLDVHIARITHADGTKEIVPGYKLRDEKFPKEDDFEIRPFDLKEVFRRYMEDMPEMGRGQHPIMGLYGWYIGKIIARRFNITEIRAKGRYLDYNWFQLYELLEGKFDEDFCVSFY